MIHRKVFVCLNDRSIFRKARDAHGAKVHHNASKTQARLADRLRALASFFGETGIPLELMPLTGLRNTQAIKNKFFPRFHRPQFFPDSFPISDRIKLSYLVFFNPLAFRKAISYFFVYLSSLSSACGVAPSRSRPHPVSFPHVNSYFVLATGRSPPVFNLPDFPNHV